MKSYLDEKDNLLNKRTNLVKILDDLPSDAKATDVLQKISDLPLIETFINGNHLGQDAENYDRADKLLKLGAPLPKPLKERKDYETKSKYFHHLANYAPDLYIALRSHPAIINEQDENGQTILHHAASIGLIMGSNSASLIQYLLFKAPGVNFSQKDLQGNTPLHLVAMNCHDRVTHTYIFNNFVEAAKKQNFNFSILNNAGQAIIHIATRIYYNHYIFGPSSNLAGLIEIVKEIDLNVLSSSGSTALYYAINHMRLAEAQTLLDAGADPKRYGSVEKSPLYMVNEYINTFTSALIDPQYSNRIERVNENINALKKIKESILKKYAGLSSDEKENKYEHAYSLAKSSYFSPRRKSQPVILSEKNDTDDLEMMRQIAPHASTRMRSKSQ